MKILEVVVLFSVCFLLLIARPGWWGKESSQRQEQQEEMSLLEYADARTENLNYRITYRAQNVSENEVIDIIWLKKAANVAIEKGIPYFNVIDQKIVRNDDLDSVKGSIELDPDPMKAEYDAQEIEALVLNDYVE